MDRREYKNYKARKKSTRQRCWDRYRQTMWEISEQRPDALRCSDEEMRVYWFTIKKIKQNWFKWERDLAIEKITEQDFIDQLAEIRKEHDLKPVLSAKERIQWKSF